MGRQGFMGLWDRQVRNLAGEGGRERESGDESQCC